MSRGSAVRLWWAAPVVAVVFGGLAYAAAVVPTLADRGRIPRAIAVSPRSLPAAAVHPVTTARPHSRPHPRPHATPRPALTPPAPTQVVVVPPQRQVVTSPPEHESESESPSGDLLERDR